MVPRNNDDLNSEHELANQIHKFMESQSKFSFPRAKLLHKGKTPITTLFTQSTIFQSLKEIKFGSKKPIPFKTQKRQ